MTKHLILSGGLGNQMFEYAFMLALRSQGHNVTLDISYYDFFEMHNGYELHRVFGIDESLDNRQGFHIQWLRLLNRIKPSSLYLYDKLEYNAQALINPPKYIKGYWQDERYFKVIAEKVKAVFQFNVIDSHNLKIAKEIRECNSISLHVRRGDYASFGMSLIGEEYYKKATEYIKERVPFPFFFIFSDDVDEARSLANRIGIEYRIISHNIGNDSYIDMFLMSQCGHNIIANSSFSWWGAWLNENKSKIVVAPREWDYKKPYFHPQPDEWILL